MIYLGLKSAHVFFLMMWISGLVIQSLILSTTLKLDGPLVPHDLSRVRILLKWERWITIPSMIMAFACGLAIAIYGHWFGQKWLMIKLCLVIMLAAIHGIQAGKIRCLSRTSESMPAKSISMLPLIMFLLSLIIWLVIFKPVF